MAYGMNTLHLLATGVGTLGELVMWCRPEAQNQKLSLRGTVSLHPYPFQMLAYWDMDGTHSVS